MAVELAVVLPRLVVLLGDVALALGHARLFLGDLEVVLAPPGFDLVDQAHRRTLTRRDDPMCSTTSVGGSSRSSSKTSSRAATACGTTSSTPTARPSSRAIVVNAASSSPQAVIHSVNGAGSRSTLRAYPCVVTQRVTWTPIEAIFRGPCPLLGGIQTPVNPSYRS